MADPALGSKQVCPNCLAKFYDLNKRPAHCPKCDTEFDPEEAVKSRRIRARAVTPDYDGDDEAEDQVKAKAASDDEDEDEEVVAPEIDQVVADDVIPTDDDEDADVDPGVGPAGDSDIDVDVDEDLADDADDDDVPFLEEEDEGFEDEIEGLPDDEEDR